MPQAIRYSVSSRRGETPQRVVQDMAAAPDLKPEADYKGADTYVKPAQAEVPKTNSFTALADALATIEPKLDKSMRDAQNIENQDQQAAGHLDAAGVAKVKEALDQNKQSWSQAVQADPELQKANPHYLRGMTESFLRNKAALATQGLDSAYGEDGALKTSLDPNAYGDFSSKQREGLLADPALQGMDPHMLAEHYLAPVDQHIQALGQKHSNVREAETTIQRNTLYEKNIMDRVGQTYDSLKGSDPLARGDRSQAIAAIVQEEMANGAKSGMLFSEVNHHAIRSLMAAARTFDDPSILDAMDHIITDPKSLSTLGGTADAPGLRAQLRQQLEAERNMKEERLHKDAWNVANPLAIEGILKNANNPGFLIGPYLVKKGVDITKLKSGDLSGWQGLANTNTSTNDRASEGSPLEIRMLQDAATDGNFDPLRATQLPGPARLRVLSAYSHTQSNIQQGFQSDLYRTGEDLRHFITKGAEMPAPEDNIKADKAATRLRDEMQVWQEEREAKKIPTTVKQYRLQAQDVANRLKSSPEYSPLADKAVEQATLSRDKANQERPAPLASSQALRMAPQDVERNNPSITAWWSSPKNFDYDVQVYERSGQGMVPDLFLKQQAPLIKNQQYLTPAERDQLAQQRAAEVAAQPKPAKKRGPFQGAPDPIYAPNADIQSQDVGQRIGEGVTHLTNTFIDWARMTPEQRQAAERRNK